MAVNNFLDVTELSGDLVSRDQITRMERRYGWVAGYARGRDVLEVACGTGQGAGLIAAVARSYVASDVSEAMLQRARQHYGGRVSFVRFDAEDMPLAAGSMYVLVVCEALYYFADAPKFFRTVRNMLRPDGVLLIVSANKDLFDFNPSPYSRVYYGVRDLRDALAPLGFQCTFFGDSPLVEASVLQRVLRPVKALVTRLGLMPKTMAGKKMLKRLVFGKLVPMPFELTMPANPIGPPSRLSDDKPDLRHKVIFCAARLAPSDVGGPASTA